MKKMMNNLHTLRDYRSKGMTMIFALCATALLLAFSLSVMYMGSALLATANRKAFSERCYQKAITLSSLIENQLTSTSEPDLQKKLSERLDKYVGDTGLEPEFSFDYLVEGEDIAVSFKTVPVADTDKTRLVTMYVTVKDKGEQQTVTTMLNYNSSWTPKFQPVFVEGN